jgi:hypothetical protein
MSNVGYGSSNTMRLSASAENITRRVPPQPVQAAMLAAQFQMPKAMSPQAPVMIGEPKVQGQVKRRVIKVYVVDTNENVPLDRAILFQGEEKVTDLTDQELFYELNMAELLKKHNEFRVTLIDKSIKERTVNLEPARIRDLSMTIVTVCEF